MDNPLAAIGGIILFLLLASIILPFTSVISDMVTEDKCKPYQEQITAKETELLGLNKQLGEVNSQLDICRGEYQTLIHENITKKDIEEIKGYFNITQVQINNLNQRFDQVSQNYYSLKNVVINRYNLSFAANLVFGFEILSFVFFKHELALLVWNWFKRRRKKENE